MILTCPSCATRYFADDGSIGPNGRAVRCGRCSITWFVEGRLMLNAVPYAEAAIGAPRPAGGNASGPAGRPQTAPARRERGNAAILGLGVTGVALIGAGAGAVALRDTVVQAWPESATIYTAMGMSVNPYGLQIADLTVTQEVEGGETIYIVRGAVTNEGGDAKAAPLLRFGLLDAQADEIHAQLADLQGRTVPAGGRLTFSFKLDGPVDRASDLEATFETDTGYGQAQRTRSDGPIAAADDAVLTLDAEQEIGPLSSLADHLDTPVGGLEALDGLRGGLSRG